MLSLSEVGAPLVQATGGSKSLALVTGDWALLVQARGGRESLVWAKGSTGLIDAWCLLHDLWLLSWRPEGGLACHFWGPMSGLHLRGQPKKKKKKKSTATKHHTLWLSPSWEYTCLAKSSKQCPHT